MSRCIATIGSVGIGSWFFLFVCRFRMRHTARQAGEQFLARTEMKLVPGGNMLEPADNPPVAGGSILIQLEHVHLVVRIAGLGIEDHLLLSRLMSTRDGVQISETGPGSRLARVSFRSGRSQTAAVSRARARRQTGVSLPSLRSL